MSYDNFCVLSTPEHLLDAGLVSALGLKLMTCILNKYLQSIAVVKPLGTGVS